MLDFDFANDPIIKENESRAHQKTREKFKKRYLMKVSEHAEKHRILDSVTSDFPKLPRPKRILKHKGRIPPLRFMMEDFPPPLGQLKWCVVHQEIKISFDLNENFVSSNDKT